jgi:hypothetical protein
MLLRCAGQLMISTVLFLMTSAQMGSAQSFSNQPSDDQVWRCSLDGKFYTVTNWNGVHIRAINSGLMMAEVPLQTDKKGRIKTDHKGNNKLEGRWGSTTNGGLIVIQDVQPDKIRGFLLAPTPGIPASSCNSRTAAAIFSFGQPAPICNVLTVSWDLQPGVSAAQAAAAEMQEVVQQVNFPAAQPSTLNNSNQQLVGTWFKEVFDKHAYYTATLVLRGDGTYTKALAFGTHSGTWTSSGTIVHLSGNGSWPPADENLSLFRKTG